MCKFPEIITFRITSKCNNACAYCYGPNKDIDSLSFSKLKELFYLFSKNGVKKIVLTGGEPLLRNDINEIILELKKYDFKIFLHTSGDFFFNHHELILKNVDFIGLPLDFYNKSYRNLENLSKILKILNFLKDKDTRPIIRIGTVITKDNHDQLEKIGKILTKYPIAIWKLYEFVPQNKATHKKELQISDQEFEIAVQKIKTKFSKNFKIEISTRKKRTNAYFFISSNGNVFMPVDDLNICKEIFLGNVFDENIIEKWKKIISEENYQHKLIYKENALEGKF